MGDDPQIKNWEMGDGQKMGDELFNWEMGDGLKNWEMGNSNPMSWAPTYTVASKCNCGYSAAHYTRISNKEKKWLFRNNKSNLIRSASYDVVQLVQRQGF